MMPLAGSNGRKRSIFMTVRFDLSGLDSEMSLALAMMPVLPKHGTDVEHFDNPTLSGCRSGRVPTSLPTCSQGSA